ncbi:hypothetical protein LY90DRAFT_334762, partial [Neocallimastix californiae]
RQQKVRFEGDMYTPKLVRYSGNTKEGFCDQCNPGRWLQLKNSAYWYHKQFFHGISSVSGKPFRSPLATKILDYAEILDSVVGLCHHCKKWIPLMITKKRKINDIINNNGMTILWYRHAHK